MANNKNQVFKAERAGKLEGKFRKLIQNPKRILGRYIKEGMTVLDFGCGSGFFTISAAEFVSSSGKVIAADLQDGMLNKVKEKIEGKEIEKRIILHKCNEDSIGIKEKVDFIIAFYVVHEVPDQKKFLKEVKSLLKPGGKLFIVEPKFKVSQKEFEKMINNAFKIGFSEFRNPKITLSRAIILQK